jgi:hypothetical protein
MLWYATLRQTWHQFQIATFDIVNMLLRQMVVVFRKSEHSCWTLAIAAVINCKEYPLLGCDAMWVVDHYQHFSGKCYPCLQFKTDSSVLKMEAAFLQNVDIDLPDYLLSHVRRQYSS